MMNSKKMLTLMISSGLLACTSSIYDAWGTEGYESFEGGSGTGLVSGSGEEQYQQTKLIDGDSELVLSPENTQEITGQFGTGSDEGSETVLERKQELELNSDDLVTSYEEGDEIDFPKIYCLRRNKMDLEQRIEEHKSNIQRLKQSIEFLREEQEQLNKLSDLNNQIMKAGSDAIILKKFEFDTAFRQWSENVKNLTDTDALWEKINKEGFNPKNNLEYFSELDRITQSAKDKTSGTNISTLDQQLENLKEAINNNNINIIVKDIDDSRAKLAKLKTQLGANQAKLTELETQSAGSKTELAELETQFEDNQTELAELEKQLEANQTRLAELGTQFEDNQGERKEDNEELEAQLSQRDQKIQELEQYNEELEAQLSEAQEQIADLEEQNVQLGMQDQKIQELEAQLKLASTALTQEKPLRDFSSLKLKELKSAPTALTQEKPLRDFSSLKLKKLKSASTALTKEKPLRDFSSLKLKKLKSAPTALTQEKPTATASNEAPTKRK